MQFSQWLAVASICILGAMSPGPSLAVVIKNSVSGSRATGILTAIGHGIGVGIYATLSVMGLAIILTGQPILFSTIQILGALYLIWLGYKALSAGSEFGQPHHADVSLTLKQGFTSGFFISFLNPKIAVFFLALFSQFVAVDSDVMTKSIYAATAGIIDALWYIFIAATVSNQKISKKLNQYSPWLDKLLAIILLIVGFRLILGVF